LKDNPQKLHELQRLFLIEVGWVQIDLEKDDHDYLISPEERFKVRWHGSKYGSSSNQEYRMTYGTARFTGSATIVFAILMVFSGCVVYEPVPAYAPPPGTLDRAWSAALGAAQEEGVRITSEDRANGIIRGNRGEQEVTIDIRTQADGNVRVEFSARGPKGSDPGLAGRISRAYDRRMGR
jgi:hypothetical protein